MKPDCSELPKLASLARLMERRDGPDYTTTCPTDEISDRCVCAQHLIGSGKVMISLVELGPSRGLMSIGV
jgi:hypothetical protein